MPTDKENFMASLNRLPHCNSLLDSVGGLVPIKDVVSLAEHWFSKSEPEPEPEPKWTPQIGNVVRFSAWVGILTVGADGFYGLTRKDGKGIGTMSHLEMFEEPTPEEIAEFYTLEFDGKLFRLYWDKDGSIWISKQHGVAWLLDMNDPTDEPLAVATLAGLGLTRDSHLIMPYEKSKGQFDKPKGASK